MGGRSNIAHADIWAGARWAQRKTSATSKTASLTNMVLMNPGPYNTTGIDAINPEKLSKGVGNRRRSMIKSSGEMWHLSGKWIARSSVRGKTPAPSTQIPKDEAAFHRKDDPESVTPSIRPAIIRWNMNAIDKESSTNNVGKKSEEL